MKKEWLLFILLILSLNIQAQKNVYLKINHLLGDQAFAFEKKTKNNLDQEFNFTRLDYFISNIKLYHNNGDSIYLNDLYLLIRNNEPVNQLLGNFNVTSLDSISFYIGIDSLNNHADPTLWPPDHALAPKTPDMHWGWASGYRFVAIEGNNGPDLAFQFQVHALGNHLKKTVRLPLNGLSGQGDEINITLDANYSNATYDTNFNKLVFIHGSTKEAINVMVNFGKRVFAVSTISSVSEVKTDLLKVLPNPVTGDVATIDLGTSELEKAVLIIQDMSGAEVVFKDNLQRIVQVHLPATGMYIAEVRANNKLLARGIIIKQ